MKIYGASDNLFEIEAGKASEEVNCYDKTPWVRVGNEVMGGLLVIGQYAPSENATWRLSIDMLDEDIPVPWPVRVEFNGYSPTVIIDCPDDTPFTHGTGVPDVDKERARREKFEAKKRADDAAKAAEAKERQEYDRLRAKFEKSR
jgi:hypothetical protein